MWSSFGGVINRMCQKTLHGQKASVLKEKIYCFSCCLLKLLNVDSGTDGTAQKYSIRGKKYSYLSFEGKQVILRDFAVKCDAFNPFLGKSLSPLIIVTD